MEQGGYANGSNNGAAINNTGSRYVPPHLRNGGGGFGGPGQRGGFDKGNSFGQDGGYSRGSYGAGAPGGYGRGGGMSRGGARGGYSNDFQQGGFGGNGYGSGRGGYSRNAGGVGGGYGGGDRGGYGRPQNGFFSRGGGSFGGGRGDENQSQGGGGGRWQALQEPVAEWTERGPRDERVEAELFAGVNSLNSGINFDKYEEIPVEATGEEVPPPISSFEDLKLHPWVEDNIQKTGYSRPTPVQKYSIPALNINRDVMSCAQTGSGKTAAFLVPLINRILQNGPSAVHPSITTNMGRRKMFPCGLVLSPTRELCLQIFNESRKFAYRTPISSALLYGGRENYRDQINKLRLGCHILIATPGRLLDVMGQDIIGLEGCKYLVLDEADRMLDMGFEPQIRQIVEMSRMPPRGERVTAMFSATFPKEIQVLAQEFLMPNYVFLAVGRVGSTSENIMQKIVWVEEHDKRSVLMDLLDAGGEVLTVVFVETKRGASDLTYYLNGNGYNVVPIHGDLKQFEREKNLDMFRTGQAPIMVATAVAARGLDIPNVKHVINYDLPNDIDEYVHRIGRTGRVGNVGLATSFFYDKNKNLARELMDLIVEANQELPEWLEKYASEAARYGVRNGGGRGRGGNKFGGRDHRTQFTGGAGGPPQFNAFNGQAAFGGPPGGGGGYPPRNGAGFNPAMSGYGAAAPRPGGGNRAPAQDWWD